MSVSFLFKGTLSRILGRSSYYPTKEFLAVQNEWQQGCTPESILAEFADCLLNGNPKCTPKFTPAEAIALKNWDKHSLESFLLARLPPDDRCRAYLTSSMPSLWMLTTYFAHWPFEKSSPAMTDTLAFPGLVIAVAFLSGRHNIMFEHWDQECAHPPRTDNLILEYIFRAFSTPRTTDQGVIPGLLAQDPSPKSPPLSDILDVLNTVQPVQNSVTPGIPYENLVPVAIRLSPLPAALPLSSCIIPTGEMLTPLLDLSVFLLQHAYKFDKEIITLVEYLESAQTKLRNNTTGLPFEVFMEWLGKNPNQHPGFDSDVYDAIALLFNTFLNSQILTDGIMTHFSSSDEVERKHMLLVFALRRPGLTGGRWL